MPTLSRAMLAAACAAAVSFGAVWSLATFIEPAQRVIVVDVPLATATDAPDDWLSGEMERASGPRLFGLLESMPLPGT